MVAIGVIRLGEDHEYFESALGFWGLDDYKAIWAAGLRRLISGASTCKITCSSLTSSRMSSIRLSRGRLYAPAPLSMKMATESQSGGSALAISKNSLS